MGDVNKMFVVKIFLLGAVTYFGVYWVLLP
jgi:hypothetical protein